VDDTSLQNQIDRLNQRGGRMLSLVDLLEAGTVDLEMAAQMAAVAAAGGSFLTAAGPGGVGKTTLMGAMLAFLPHGARIVPIESARTLDRLPPPSTDETTCLVVHEIGSGPYYAYLWGPAVGRYFEAARPAGRCLASNLHAETYDEAVRQLAGLDVTDNALAEIDLLAFMAMDGRRRRVTSVWHADGTGGHREAWRRDPRCDAFEQTGPLPPALAGIDLGPYRALLASAVSEGVRRIGEVRERYRRRSEVQGPESKVNNTDKGSARR
jgi:hypothetical protein